MIGLLRWLGRTHSSANRWSERGGIVAGEQIQVSQDYEYHNRRRYGRSLRHKVEENGPAIDAHNRVDWLLPARLDTCEIVVQSVTPYTTHAFKLECHLLFTVVKAGPRVSIIPYVLR